MEEKPKLDVVIKILAYGHAYQTHVLGDRSGSPLHEP